MSRPQFNALNHLTALRAFEAAARLGSFKAAAEELFVTDSAVSRQIRQLEEAAGVHLFLRRNRRVELTAEGRGFARELQPAFQQIRRAGADLAGMVDAQPLVIAAPATFLLRWLIPRQASLQKAVPGTPIRLATWDAPPDPSDQSISLFVGIGEAADDPSCACVDLMPESFALVVSPMLVGQGASIQDVLAGLPRLVPQTRPNIWNDWIGEGGFDAPFSEILEFERMFFALQAAEAGMGSTIAPVEIVTDSLSAGRLTMPFAPIVRNGTYHLIYSKRRGESPMVKNAVRWFVSECARVPAVERRSR